MRFIELSSEHLETCLLLGRLDGHLAQFAVETVQATASGVLGQLFLPLGQFDSGPGQVLLGWRQLRLRQLARVHLLAKLGKTRLNHLDEHMKFLGHRVLGQLLVCLIPRPGDLFLDRLASGLPAGHLHLQVLDRIGQVAPAGDQLLCVFLGAQRGGRWLRRLQFFFADDDHVIVDLVGDVGVSAADGSDDRLQGALQFDRGWTVHVNRCRRLDCAALLQFLPQHDDGQRRFNRVLQELDSFRERHLRRQRGYVHDRAQLLAYSAAPG